MKTKENWSLKPWLNLLICIVVYIGLRVLFHQFYADGDADMSVSINVFGILIASIAAVIFMIKMIVNFEARNVLLSNMRLLIISLFAWIYWVPKGAFNELPGLIPVATTFLFGLALIMNLVDFFKENRQVFNKSLATSLAVEFFLMLIALVGTEIALT